MDHFWAVWTSLIAAIIIMLPGFIYSIYSMWRNLLLISFWREILSSDKISIIFSEYENIQHGLVKSLGIKYLVSKGSAYALSRIMVFLLKQRPKMNIEPQGDKTARNDVDANIILIGSPATNNHCKIILKKIEDMYDIPLKFKYDDKNIAILNEKTSEIFETEVENDNGNDYALIVKARISDDPEMHCIVLAGISMWGVEGAAKFLTDPNFFNKAFKQHRNGENVFMLIKTQVIQGEMFRPEIIPFNNSKVTVLNERRQ